MGEPVPGPHTAVRTSATGWTRCGDLFDQHPTLGLVNARILVGGEEETLAYPLAKAGWAMRYRPEFVMHHQPSLANAGGLRAWGMRNTLVNAWLHRRLGSALRWTAFTAADTPKNRDFARAASR